MRYEHVRTRNAYTIKKGHIPWNKGIKGSGGRSDEKGKQGYQPRAVLWMNYDGTVKHRFESVKEAMAYFEVCRKSVTAACYGKFLCRGAKLVYEDEYVGWADYSYRPTAGRDIYGRLLKGHHNNATNRKMSAETRARIAEARRDQCKRMCADPDSKWGKGGKLKAVECVDTGERFESLKAAGEHFGLNPANISGAIGRNGRIHGLKFRYVKKRDADGGL